MRGRAMVAFVLVLGWGCASRPLDGPMASVDLGVGDLREADLGRLDDLAQPSSDLAPFDALPADAAGPCATPLQLCDGVC